MALQLSIHPDMIEHGGLGLARLRDDEFRGRQCTGPPEQCVVREHQRYRLNVIRLTDDHFSPGGALADCNFRSFESCGRVGGGRVRIGDGNGRCRQDDRD